MWAGQWTAGRGYGEMGGAMERGRGLNLWLWFSGRGFGLVGGTINWWAGLVCNGRGYGLVGGATVNWADCA